MSSTADLSVVINNVHHFRWPEDAVRDAIQSSPAAPPYRPTTDVQRAVLAAYLNDSLRPATGSEWVIPRANDQSADFLSVPVPHFGFAPARSGSRRVRGAAPAAAVCLSTAVTNGTPSSGLRVVLELAPPCEVSSNTGPGVSAGEESAVPVTGTGTGTGVDREEMLHRAIASLVAANARSPLSKPVVVLTDLQDVWKLIWLGGTARSLGGRDSDDARLGSSSRGSCYHGLTDVFVWRLGAADAASVIRSMLLEETASWDGEVSWVARSGGGGGGSNSSSNAWPYAGGRGSNGSFGGGRDGRSPMASLRNRHHRSGGGSDSRDGRTLPPDVFMELPLRQGGSLSGPSVAQGQQHSGDGERDRRMVSAPGAVDIGGSGHCGSGSSYHGNGGTNGYPIGHFNTESHSNGHSNNHVLSDAVGGGTGGPIAAPVNPLVSEPDVLNHLIPFVADDGFLFVAGVSRSWRRAWGVERQPETRIDAAVQSPSRLGWARSSGCAWSSNICARAASGGYLATLRYARAIRCPWDWRTCAHAATKVCKIAWVVPVGAV